MSTRELPDGVPTRLFINGEWLDGAREPITVEDPSTGRILTSVAGADVNQALSALTAAVDAQREWAALPSRIRSDLLRAAFDAVIARRADFARVMSLEMGKSLTEADGEVTYGAEFLRWFSEEAVRVSGRVAQLPEGHLDALVLRRPIGPVLLLTPWNFPLAMATRKLGPALAAGCTVVLRPARWTPLTTLLLTQVLADVGVPAGVVNVITSAEHDVTDAILADPRLRKLSFTGSTPVGQRLLRQAADGVLNTSMELGGNAPFLVFDDADLKVAVTAARAAKLRTMGEACTAANRFLVHQSLAAEFTDALVAEFEGVRCGDPLAESTDLGPLVSEDARLQLHGLVQRAVEAGATLRCGGVLPTGPGWFYPATVLADVAHDAEIMTTEIFGPVAPIATFRDEAEAVALANSVPVGLASYLMTRDLARVQRLAHHLEYGLIGVNTGVMSNAAAPFGGIKHSGLGREGGIEGITDYLETTYLALPTG